MHSLFSVHLSDLTSIPINKHAIFGDFFGDWRSNTPVFFEQMFHKTLKANRLRCIEQCRNQSKILKRFLSHCTPNFDYLFLYTLYKVSKKNATFRI